MSLSTQRAIVLRGDPGLFDILKRGVAAVTRTAVSFLPGPVAPVLAAFGRQPSLPPPQFIARPGGMIQRPTPGVAGGVQRLLPGGATGFESMGCPKGFHANRSSYHTQAGFVERGTKCVRNRRRNLSNGRANTRALRRMAAWEKQDKKRRVTLKAIARSAS